MQPQLDGTNRLSQRRLHPERGELLGEDGAPIVEVRAVFRIGIDKSRSVARRPGRRQSGSPELVKINSKAYAAKVAAAGSSAFVPAIVLRMDAPEVPLGSEIRAIPGALSIKTGQMLAPTQLCETHHRDRR